MHRRPGDDNPPHTEGSLRPGPSATWLRFQSLDGGPHRVKGITTGAWDRGSCVDEMANRCGVQFT